jgi:hypothetical protein
VSAPITTAKHFYPGKLFYSGFCQIGTYGTDFTSAP